MTDKNTKPKNCYWYYRNCSGIPARTFKKCLECDRGKQELEQISIKDHHNAVGSRNGAVEN